MKENDPEYLKELISQLPAGNITYKMINGKQYPYLQWRDQNTGRQRSRVIKQDELEELSQKISLRKEYEKKYVAVNKNFSSSVNTQAFFSSVLLGRDLYEFAAPTTHLKKRECYSELHGFVYGNSMDRVFILFGLRRTGKTTLIRQLLAEMDAEMLAKAAFLQVNASMNLEQINLDLKRLSDLGYRFLFIDEVTLIDDFIECAALFSDVYATRGIKIVLSGTDSLGFIFSEDRELYDRCFMLHTTFVPYREFEGVLGIHGIDEYIRYGGTMSLGGVDYNRSRPTFATKESTDEYVDIAIAHNIQHSLKNYQHGGHFRHLYELYEAEELTSAVNRVVEDINHQFTLEVLTRDFQSSDLSLSAKNLLRDREASNDILYQVNREEVTEQLRQMLEIKNKPELRVPITDAHRRELKEYLDLLDLTIDLDIVYFPDLNKKGKHTAISQPGLRYAQAEALIKVLMNDNVFRNLSLQERTAVTQRIMSDIKGRMLEDIVLLETKIARPDCEVFKLVFAVGEFDMVIFDPNSASCQIFEIKHSTEMASQQTRHLLDNSKCRDTEHRYGSITGKYVLYRGETQKVGEIQYQNVEEYLKAL
ncbi:MAG: AAA family ATPase [Lachnospiraceae bacterium]|nr:AAA family ATPase [Lachnospiraceae bacterium]